MTTEESIFEQASGLPAGEQAEYLEHACVGQPVLRTRIEALLRAHLSTGFMEGPGGPDEPTLSSAAGPDWAQTLPEQPGSRIGRYRLLQQIGEGGFGVVWMAEQMEPVTRRVALKVIRAGMDTREVIARFEAERQALALMDHPNIAQVFDAGATDQGRPYFVMELVKGVPITQFCDDHAFTTRQRLELFSDVCSAINHAHQKGVIHRDIKPSNVMVTLHCDKPVIKVIDFGIAKATQGRLTDKTLFTRFEQFVGTPAYMSPEQSALGGLDMDTRSDIYALGVLLYELLTGRPPFEAKSLLSAGYEEMRRIIREVDPPKPSARLDTIAGDERTAVAKARRIEPEQINRLVEPDLDWIVMKAIEKDRTRRYETANGLALDIGRFLANEPVSAAAPSAVYLFHKFARRHRAVLGWAALIAVLLLTATAVSLWQAKRAYAAKNDTADALAKLEGKKSEVDRQNARQQEMLAEAARLNRLVAEEKLLAGKEHEAFAHLARAIEYDPSSTLAAEQAVLALNTWSRPPPTAILMGHGGSVSGTAFSLDGERIVTASGDKTARVWDAATGQSLAILVGHDGFVESAALNPDGTRIVTASFDKTARVWDTATGQCLVTLVGHDNLLLSTAFSPDGTRIVTTSEDKTARVWHTATGHCLATFTDHDGYIRNAAFSPDGGRIVTASEGKTAQVWDTITGQSLAILVGHEDEVMIAGFSPDGVRIVTASGDRTARVWDAATGHCLATLGGHGARVMSAGFSPDGARIVTASEDRTARVWDATTGQSLATLVGHEAEVTSAEFSPDGARIVTASWDWTARVWDATTGQQLAILAGHDNIVSRARFSPDGARIATASWDGTARVWDAATTPSLVTLVGHEAGVTGAKFGPDSARIVTVSQDKTARVWDATTGRGVATLAGHTDSLRSAQFGPNRARIVTVSWDWTARVWDAATGQYLATLGGAADMVDSAVFSPDGARIITASVDSTVRVWDAATGQILSTLERHDSGVISAEFSPDGSRIVTVSKDNTARVWDTATAQNLATLAGFVAVRGAVFSSDSSRIVTRGDGMTAQVWDSATGQNLATLTGHNNYVESALFSPNGSRIVTVSQDKTARVWDAATGQNLAILAGHTNDLRSASFSPDGSRIVTASYDATARVWDATTGQSLAVLKGHDNAVQSAEYSPDGTRIVTASADKTARVWTILPATAGPPPLWFPDFLRYLAQTRLNSDGDLESIEQSDWLALRERLRAVRRENEGKNTPYLRIFRLAMPE